MTFQAQERHYSDGFAKWENRKKVLRKKVLVIENYNLYNCFEKYGLKSNI
jgi:hypothetical protein